MIDNDDYGNMMNNLTFFSYLSKFCLRLYLHFLALCFNLEVSFTGRAEHIINAYVSLTVEELCL